MKQKTIPLSDTIPNICRKATITKRAVKTCSIAVNAEGQIKLTVPHYYTNKQVNSLLVNQLPWIESVVCNAKYKRIVEGSVVQLVDCPKHRYCIIGLEKDKYVTVRISDSAKFFKEKAIVHYIDSDLLADVSQKIYVSPFKIKDVLEILSEASLLSLLDAIAESEQFKPLNLANISFTKSGLVVEDDIPSLRSRKRKTKNNPKYKGLGEISRSSCGLKMPTYEKSDFRNVKGYNCFNCAQGGLVTPN